MKNQIKVFFVSILLLCSTNVFAEGVDIVTLTTTAEGKTKDEAVTNALRSAIEQAFGAFISSKTEIVNDDLIRDEIVSVSSGNVKKYEIVSSQQLQGSVSVVVQADVSLSKLTTFCKNNGIEVEFAGELFGANIKLRELYAKNEMKVIDNLIIPFSELVKMAYDYKIIVKDPIKSSNWSRYEKIKDIGSLSPNYWQYKSNNRYAVITKEVTAIMTGNKQGVAAPGCKLG
jgi:hypothetical protein